ncbi:hypothetical protein GMRT_14476 [Giardia muris]|uniref:Uncharacterized protein n=1 Tax=Giardia muris TaxID=5742 RepID=A0A4Z1SQX8_GIAMU|nr:hypothetical protein GMRT_14476 [Giardia muris]|eukprot:TNJ28256.1 hypothetical protein GMRT_14476 [Giardia muris]
MDRLGLLTDMLQRHRLIADLIQLELEARKCIIPEFVAVPNILGLTQDQQFLLLFLLISGKMETTIKYFEKKTGLPRRDITLYAAELRKQARALIDNDPLPYGLADNRSHDSPDSDLPEYPHMDVALFSLMEESTTITPALMTRLPNHDDKDKHLHALDDSTTSFDSSHLNIEKDGIPPLLPANLDPPPNDKATHSPHRHARKSSSKSSEKKKSKISDSALKLSQHDLDKSTTSNKKKSDYVAKSNPERAQSREPARKTTSTKPLKTETGSKSTKASKNAPEE